MRFIIQKYIHASSALEAIKKDKFCPVHDCYVDIEWKKINDEKSDFGLDAPKSKKIGEK